MNKDLLKMPNQAQALALRHPEMLERPLNEDLEEADSEESGIDEWDAP